MKVIKKETFYLSENLGLFKAILQNQKEYDAGYTYEWLSCWWKYYGELGVAKKDLLLLADEDKNGIYAIWPLFIRHRYGMKIIHWIGQVDGMTTDYSGPLIVQSDWEKAAKNLLQYLNENHEKWDMVDLRIPSWDCCFPALAKCLALFGNKLELRWEGRIADYSVSINLPSTFEQYLLLLGKKTRSDVQQYINLAGKNGLIFNLYYKQDALERLPLLFSLNSLNWPIFKHELSRAFITQVTRELSAGNEGIFLGVLENGGEAIATVFGFKNNGTCFLHPAGIVRQTVAGVSPGITMYALLIKDLIRDGIKKLDLSPGLEEYKLRLGGMVEPVYQLMIWHDKLRITRWRLFDWMRKMKKSLNLK